MENIFRHSFLRQPLIVQFDDATRSTFKAAQARLKALKPSQAIKAAYDEAPTSSFILQLCIAAEVDTRYSRSAMVTMLMHHIVHGQDSSVERSRRHWEWPLYGLNAITWAMGKKIIDDGGDFKESWEDFIIRQRIQSFYPVLVDVISKDLSFLRPAGDMANARRYLVINMLLFSTTDTQNQMKMYDQSSIRLALTCWLYSKPGDSHCHLAPYLIANLFGKKHAPPQNCLSVAYQSFDIGIFVSRLNLILQCKGMDARLLEMQIVAIIPFIHNLVYRIHIVEAHIHTQLVASVKIILIKSAKKKTNIDNQVQEDAQAASADAGTSEAQINALLQSCGYFLCALLESAMDTAHTLLDLIRNTAMMEVCAAALQILNRTSCMEDIGTPWHLIITLISNLSDPSRCGRAPLPGSWEDHLRQELVQAVRTAIESVAIPVVHSLTSEGGAHCSDAPHSDYADIWKGLVDCVGITEESSRGSYKDQRKCCNIKCPSRKFETCLLLTPKKSICAGCRSAFYCDKECQIMDWKYHKEECKKTGKALAQ
ncbi:hypothetical protein CPC08DRAFT_817713 [Agrocybe pediades]|nr:hypothetical protein CPC08DRAFT_817713 [Agrocybe pediades]